MRWTWKKLVLAGGLGVAAAGMTCPAWSQSPEPAPSAERGRSLYNSYCARCHGLNMVSSGTAFFDLRTFPKDQQARFEGSVTQGLRAMPAWGSILKPADVQALWLYVTAGR